MKPVIISADAGDVIRAGKFLKGNGSGAVVENDTAGVTPLGMSESKADTTTFLKVGCIKQGLIHVNTANDVYNFGDTVELGSDGQLCQAVSTGDIIAKVAETKTTTTADNLLLVYINLA